MEPDTDSRFWWPAIGVTLLLAAIVLTAMFLSDYRQPQDSFRIEAAKLLLQFVLVGVGGALVLAYLNQRRDRAEKAELARIAAETRAASEKAAQETKEANARAVAQARVAARRESLQDFIRQIGDAHRRLKVVKRQMRAAIAREEADPRGPPDRPYRLPVAAFDRAMEALLSAQIASEEVRDRIEISVDLLDPHQIRRIRRALRYGARYFHDAFEDYEHGRVKREGDDVLITSMCNNLHNFLFAREPPPDLSPEARARLDQLFKTMREEGRDLGQRFAALDEIEALRHEDCPRRRRYRGIATECFALAADELRQALWHTCLEPAPPPAPQGLAAARPGIAPAA